jgi:hypothetical protein
VGSLVYAIAVAYMQWSSRQNFDHKQSNMNHLQITNMTNPVILGTEARHFTQRTVEQGSLPNPYQNDGCRSYRFKIITAS